MEKIIDETKFTQEEVKKIEQVKSEFQQKLKEIDLINPLKISYSTLVEFDDEIEIIKSSIAKAIEQLNSVYEGRIKFVKEIKKNIINNVKHSFSSDMQNEVKKILKAESQEITKILNSRYKKCKECFKDLAYVNHIQNIMNTENSMSTEEIENSMSTEEIENIMRTKEIENIMRTKEIENKLVQMEQKIAEIQVQHEERIQNKLINMKNNKKEERNYMKNSIEKVIESSKKDELIVEREEPILEKDEPIVEKEEPIPEKKYQKLIDELKKEKFTIEGNNLYFIKNTQKGTYQEISNFIPIVLKRIKYVNGIDIHIKYTLKAVLINNWEELPEIEVTKRDYEKFSFVIGSSWERYALLKEYSKFLPQVAQISSKVYMEDEKVYLNTGFEKIDGQLCYLYHGGAIGKNVNNIKANLSADALTQYKFHNEELNTTESIKTSYSILELAKHNISIPLLATTYLAPLVSILQEEQILCDFSLFLVGKTGTRKSSVASILLSHNGIFNRNQFSTSFTDTINSLEKKAYILKDTLFIADDLCPENDNSRIHTLDKLLGMFRR